MAQPRTDGEPRGRARRAAHALLFAVLAASCARRAPPAGGAAVAPASEPAGVTSGPAAVTVRLGPSWGERDNPAKEGWDSEVFSAEAQRQLDAFGKLVLHAEEATDQRLGALVTDDFSCGALRPQSRRTVFKELLKVERALIQPTPAGATPATSHRGLAGLREALLTAGRPFSGAQAARFKLKIVRVEPKGPSVATRQYLEALSRGPAGLLEWTATWAIGWARGAGGEPPRIRSIQVVEHEEVSRPSPEPLFADCTVSVLGKNPSFREQFLRGYNHWLERIQDRRFYAILGTPGLAVGDVNGDGLDDLYVGQEGGLPNRLFLQNPDGTATDASEASGANWIDSTRGVLLVDLDQDGDQDLAAAVLGALVLAANDGTGRFTIGAVLATSQDTMSLSAADYDQDGDLDLYVCAYKRDDLVQGSGVISIDTTDEFLYYDANDGAPNVLFRNDSSGGEWRFTDATDEVGLGMNNRRYSFAAAWEDFDRDGDVDLYVANDFGRNNLYRNDSMLGAPARFTDIAALAGAEDRAASMSVSWGDFNRDGWPDLYVGNMFSSAGGRITTQALFKPDATPEVRSYLQRFARGNTLLQNLGNGTFGDVSEEANVTMGRWAWSSIFVDLNNDGLEDLVVANGYITTEDPGDL